MAFSAFHREHFDVFAGGLPGRMPWDLCGPGHPFTNGCHLWEQCIPTDMWKWGRSSCSWMQAQKHQPCLMLSVLPLTTLQFLSHSSSLEMRSKLLQNCPPPAKLGLPWDVHISWLDFASLFTNYKNKFAEGLCYWSKASDRAMGYSLTQGINEVTGTRRKAWICGKVRSWDWSLVSAQNWSRGSLSSTLEACVYRLGTAYLCLQIFYSV